MESQEVYFLLKYQQEIVARFDLPLGKDEITVGRKGFGADIEIPSPGVSRLHASIRWVNKNHFRVIDHQSTNGTYLNGVRIEESSIRNGDVISFQKNQSEYTLLVNAREELYTSHPDGKPTPLEHLIEPQKSLYELLLEKDQILIGRQDCDITLANLTISRKHTSISRQSDGKYLVTDLGSKNGTFINGQPINTPTLITDKDLIQIGKYEFNLSSTPLTEVEAQTSSEVIVADNLFKSVGIRDKKKDILHNINFKVAPGEMVAIMGPSGSGKSTLLRALNGYAPATSGKVFIHGKDLYRNYKLLKQDIGYVPQDDIVHKQLSIYHSLYFAARLRLASDLSKQEIDAKIEEILDKLGILHIKDSLIKDISGGQRKRVSIAVELLSDPSILFLDEPTSPLDPETIDEFLKILKKLSEGGTTILIVTHKPDDLDIADKVVFLSKGGYMVFYGGVKEYLDYFQAKNVIAVYASINNAEKGKEWSARFNHQNHQILTLTPNEKIKQPRKQSAFRQLYWLSARYFKIKTNDRINTLILVFQAPLIALLLVVLFEKVMLQTLFLMIVAAVWLGTSNAAREIIGELSIYQRERMFNLRIIPYIFSKLLVINFFSLIQMLMMVAVIHLSLGLFNYWEYVGLLLLLAFTGSLMGLALSALVDNADKVMSLVPLVLLPQIMLAGVIQRIDDKNEWISFLTVARWGMEASANISQEAYFYYPDKVPNRAYFQPLQGISPLDSLRIAEIKDSLREAQVRDSLHRFVREPILGNANMITYPTYYDFEVILGIIGIHILLLFGVSYLALRAKDRL
ncbi:MAG: ATP-binding cassette domain-containing protein [Microscillaceae bacterium]|nr:ATP-binding cassette domain-containing protein [Microscillaceae bacterium]